MANLFSFDTPFGDVNVGQDAAEDFQGLIEELTRAGAPLKKIGSYNYRNIAGTNILSEHAKGKAIDVGNQQARDVVDPEFRQWVEENPERYSQILQKYNMRGGESFRNPDLGHIEWRGEGAGNPMHEAAPLGGAMPANYDTEDRTAVGLGGSRAYAPEEEAVADATGQPRGILDMMGMRQQQQPGGLLGMLGDPETMAYLAMIAKGASPYSALDPNSMLQNAHTIAMKREALRQRQAENALDNRRADERLGLDRQRFGLTEREYNEQQEERKRQQARDQAALDRLSGKTEGTAAVPDPTATTDPAAPAATRREQLEKRLENLNREWPNVSEKLRPQLRMEIERTEKALGMSPAEERTYTGAKEAKTGAEAAKFQVDRAVEILQNPNLYEGAKKGVSGFVGGIIGESNMPETARQTAQLDRIMSTEGLKQLAQHLKPLSEREGVLIMKLMNAPGMAISEKKQVMEELQAEINKRHQGAKDTISDLEERERAGTAARRRGGDSGGGALPGGWTVKVKP